LRLNAEEKTMITFRPMNLETDAADMARIYSHTTVEPITEKTARDWWSPRKGMRQRKCAGY